MASWMDIVSLLMTVLFFVGTILGILYVVRHVSSRVATTKESLKNKGITITREGVSLKTETRFDRDDYVDATQRGFVRALNAATVGPDSNKQAFLPPPKREGRLFGMALRRSRGGERDETR